MDTAGSEGRSEQQAEPKFDLYKHVVAYIGVNALLLIINLLFSPDYIWAVWPMMGWGIAIIFHALSAFINGRKAGNGIRKREWGRH